MLPARFYRRKAAEVRRTAEGVTTLAVKARLLSAISTGWATPLKVLRKWQTL